MCCKGNINQTYIIEDSGGDLPVISACTKVSTNRLVSCNTDAEIDLSGNEIIINKDLTPINDADINIGTYINRFREINTVSGTTSYWSATTINTNFIDLGFDSSNESRVLTADNILITNDILNGGLY